MSGNMMNAEQALAQLQAQLVGMNAPADLRTKILATVATCEEAYIPLTCKTMIAALAWLDAVRRQSGSTH
jgi:hypothetical protein